MCLPGRDVLLHIGPFSTEVTEKINPQCPKHSLNVINYLVSLKKDAQRERRYPLWKKWEKESLQITVCFVSSDEKPGWETPDFSRKGLLSQSLATQEGATFKELHLHKDLAVPNQAWLTVTSKLNASDELSRKQSSPDLSVLCFSDRDEGSHPSDPSYSTSSFKEYWLTSGDRMLPFLSFSSTLFLRFCSWSFSFWRAWTCSEIFLFSSAVLLWSCTLFSDNSWSKKFRRVDIFKLSVFKA